AATSATAEATSALTRADQSAGTAGPARSVTGPGTAGPPSPAVDGGATARPVQPAAATNMASSAATSAAADAAAMRPAGRINRRDGRAGRGPRRRDGVSGDSAGAGRSRTDPRAGSPAA